MKSVHWSKVDEEHGVFAGDYHFPSLAQALEDATDDDPPDVCVAAPIGFRLPKAAELLEHWAEDCGCDADGNGPEMDIPQVLIDQLNAALDDVSGALPGWYEAMNPVDLTGYPWGR